MSERLEVCKQSFERVKRRLSGLRSGFDNSFSAESLRDIWTAFDAFLGDRYPDSDNRRMQEKYAQKYHEKYVQWSKSDRFTESINGLIKLAPVKDMRPVNPGRDAILVDFADLSKLLFLLYRIRSNLDHGAKNLLGDIENSRRNRALVENALNVTYELLERTLREEKIISN